MFTKEEYRAEIDAYAAKAAASQERYDAAIAAQAAAVEVSKSAWEQWQRDLSLLDGAVRLYVKAHLSEGDSRE